MSFGTKFPCISCEKFNVYRIGQICEECLIRRNLTFTDNGHIWEFSSNPATYSHPVFEYKCKLCGELSNWRENHNQIGHLIPTDLSIPVTATQCIKSEGVNVTESIAERHRLHRILQVNTRCLVLNEELLYLKRELDTLKK